MRHPSLRCLILALPLVFGITAMTAHAQTSAGYALPGDGTLLSVSVSAECPPCTRRGHVVGRRGHPGTDGNTAMRQNAEQMTKVMAAVKAAGIADKDVQTSGISLSPQYRYRENEAPAITGYQASNTVSLKVRDIASWARCWTHWPRRAPTRSTAPASRSTSPSRSTTKRA